MQDERLKDDNLLQSIKQEKQYNERKIDQLLDRFYQEDKYADSLKLLGSKYQERLKQFQNLKVENMELRIQTRKMHQQLAMWRSTPQDSVLREQDFHNRLSVDKGKLQSISKMGLTQVSARQEMRPKMEEVAKLKELALKQRNVQDHSYDEIIGNIYKYLQQAYNTQKLVSEMLPSAESNSQGEMVLVPRKRYQQLIEIYSINMADINLKELQKQVQSKKLQKLPQANFQEESKALYKQKYGNIIKQPNIQVSNLEIFFRKLSQKFGFQKEWQRYHTSNTNQAINLKGRIDAILNKQSSSSHLKQARAQTDKTEADSPIAGHLRGKLNSLVQQLNFTIKQKQYWTSLSERIHKDQLLDMRKIYNIIQQNNKKRQQSHLSNISDLISTILRQCLQKFVNLLQGRYKRQIVNFSMIEEQVRHEDLQKKISLELSQNKGSDLWAISRSISGHTLTNIFAILDKHFVFTSTNQLYRKLIRPN